VLGESGSTVGGERDLRGPKGTDAKKSRSQSKNRRLRIVKGGLEKHPGGVVLWMGGVEECRTDGKGQKGVLEVWGANKLTFIGGNGTESS